MTRKEIYKTWAPEGAKWTNWVRPVPFIELDNLLKSKKIYDITLPKINYIEQNKKNIAIIVDLPGFKSITEGISLVQYGFRPIPLYNGTTEQENSIPTTDNNSIQAGLIWGANILKETKIDEDAPPAFLIDSNRLNRHKINVSIFDNSWDLYHQDMPTAEYFIKNGIDTIIIRGDKVAKDLNKILFEFPQKGVRILFTNGYDKPKEVKLKKPPRKEMD